MFCRDKNISRDKHKFVATKLVKTNICRDKHNFATTKSRRNTPFVATKLCMYNFCRDKTFVATKMILVAAPANDKLRAHLYCLGLSQLI